MRAVALMCLTLAGMASAATPSPFERILAGIELDGNENVPFVELRKNKLLAAPARFEGTVSYDPDGRLIKNVTAPVAQRAIVSEDRLTLVRDGRTRHLNLDRRRRLGVYFDSLRALLGGDAGKLMALFDVRVEESGAHWAITMTPTDDRLEAMLESIVVRGRGGEVASVRTQQSPESWQELRFGEPSREPVRP